MTSDQDDQKQNRDDWVFLIACAFAIGGFMFAWDAGLGFGTATAWAVGGFIGPFIIAARSDKKNG